MNIECAPGISCESDQKTDFRPSLIKTHFESLINDGYSSHEAEDIILGITNRELTYLFLERYAKERLVHFSYHFEGDKLMSSRYEAFGDVRERFKAAIKDRIIANNPFSREKAEFEGVEQIRKEALESTLPKTFLLISPPPLVAERHFYPGYADYSFYFFGRFDPQSRVIDMFAWNNNKSLEKQTAEANALFGQEIFSSGEAHPNDFLRTPIFRNSADFEHFRQIIKDMPREDDFVNAKSADYSKYQDEIAQCARMLTKLIAAGADDEVLQKALAQTEMEFMRMIVGKRGTFNKIDTKYLAREYHNEFASRVKANFAVFAQVYKNEITKFACGSCGGSILGLYTSSTSRFSLIMEFSNELFTAYRSCPNKNCGKLIKSGSEACANCGLTKKEYDARSIKAA